MSLIQFWRILWAGRLLVLGTTICCLLGGVAAIVMSPPRWTAQTHVFLNILKPDPITGQFLDRQTQTYIATQIDLVTDYSVAGLTVDKLGWLSEPALIQAYQKRNHRDTRDYRHWLAQLITVGTGAWVEYGSNILNIRYTSATPEGAMAVANAVTQSYLDTSLAFRRADAIRNADWYGLQAQKTKTSLEEAETEVANFERDNGVFLTQNGKTDIDSSRLLASMAVQDLPGSQAASSTSVNALLAETDAAVKNASSIMGPNNPQMQALQAKRASYAALLAREQGAANATLAATGASRLDAQKALVISQSGKLATLKNLQAEVDIRRELYNRTAQKEANFRQEAAVTNAGLTLLNDAAVPESPYFPNIPLIVAGSLMLGLLNGALLVLLVEFLNRKVRGIEDLLSMLNLPVLAIVVAPR
ncbi:MAG TPA: Wzz/FepE/Etk N-terminal domain-containing protein [Rhizomicrobium sp.]|jgi:succinoglycan biosynthesis transport protein ExoP|nr:Wzz/FepE/Etk N-terminal domain-containing protein [Rhizomicrobium sp.]